MIDIDRGTNGRTARLRSLDVESQQDFVRGFREWIVTDMDAQIRDHSEALLQAHGVTGDRSGDVETLRTVFDPDPLIAARLRVWITNQRQLWAGLSGQLGRHRDHYLAELDRYDAMGPGGVELDPNLKIPDYCRHEIHIQPGGYVGDELAGPIYHYGTNSFYMGQNDADEFHTMLARRTARPHDGQVRTIVDLGTGIGQLAMTLKETFPDAEVTGLDVGLTFALSSVSPRTRAWPRTRSISRPPISCSTKSPLRWPTRFAPRCIASCAPAGCSMSPTSRRAR